MSANESIDKINFKLSDEVMFSIPFDVTFEYRIDDEGKEHCSILTGKYEDDNGNTKYKNNVSVSLLSEEDEGDDRTSILDNLSDKEWAIELEGPRRAAFFSIPFSKMKTFSLFGQTMTLVAVYLYIETDSGELVALMSPDAILSSEKDTKDKIVMLCDNFIEVAKAIEINGEALNFTGISVDRLVREFELFTSEEVYSTDDIIIDFMKESDFDPDLKESLLDLVTQDDFTLASYDFTSVSPDESLYPHYGGMLKVKNSILGLMGANINESGTEYSFIPIRDADEFHETYDEMKPVYDRIIAKDTGRYDLHKQAKKMQKLFGVNKSAFDRSHDRECELEEGYMHRAYMMSGLRSFAWTLTDYCKRYDMTPEEIDYGLAHKIVNFVADEEWLNYKKDDNCKGLCSGSDLHVYFVPDGVSQADRRKFLPEQEDYDRVKRMQSVLPQYREILAEVHSLDALREDLVYIYPAVQTLWDHLAEERDYDEPLLGNDADIVYAWCALALAAEEPFFSEDGPMTCYFHQLPYDESERVMLKTVAKPDVTKRKKEESKKSTKKPRRTALWSGEWMDKYGKYVESNPEIEINGKKFTFSGLTTRSKEKTHRIVNKLTFHGGQHRLAVSSVTDYLVVNPDKADEAAIKLVIEQREKGKQIRVILLEDLEKALEAKSSKLTGHDYAGVPSYYVEATDDDFIKDDDGETFRYIGDHEYVIIPCVIHGKEVTSYDYMFQEGFSTGRKIRTNPKGVASINTNVTCMSSMFYGCRGITELDLRYLDTSYVKSMYSMFDGCSSLTSLDLSNFNTSKVTNMDSMFSQCSELTTLDLSSFNTSEVWNMQWMFWGCSSLTSLNLSSLTTPRTYDMGRMFEDCTSLEVLDLSTFKLPEYDSMDNMFENCTSLTTVYVRTEKDAFLLNKTNSERINYVDKASGKVYNKDDLSRKHSESSGDESSFPPTSNQQANPWEQPLKPPESNKQGACYIATAVYGSYDAPQVLTLRNFRDQKLSNSAAGRWFIRTYYKLSPPVAERLKDAKKLNHLVKYMLNKWIIRLDSK